jgi:hypothetical protein
MASEWHSHKNRWPLLKSCFKFVNRWSSQRGQGCGFAHSRSHFISLHCWRRSWRQPLLLWLWRIDRLSTMHPSATSQAPSIQRILEIIKAIVPVAPYVPLRMRATCPLLMSRPRSQHRCALHKSLSLRPSSSTLLRARRPAMRDPAHRLPSSD